MNSELTTAGATVPATTDTQSSVLSVIERVALDPQIDTAKMQQLLDMQLTIMAKQSEDAFNNALVAAQAEIARHPVIRNRENKHTRSTYADLQAVNEVAVPLLTKHGINLSFQPEDCPDPQCVRLGYTISGHGHTRRGSIDMPLDGAGSQGNTNKTAIHARKSAYTYAQRTLVTLICNIATTDDDGNSAGNVGEPITDKQVADLEAMITEVGADRDGFMKYLRITKLEDLPASTYSTAVKALEAKRRSK